MEVRRWRGAGGEDVIERDAHGEEAEAGQGAGDGNWAGGHRGRRDEHDRQLHDSEGPEDSAARGVHDPGHTTREGREPHELTHLPFRPWYADCVAGKD